MRKIIPALILFLSLLTGCTHKTAEDVVSKSQRLISESRRIAFTADVTADYGERVYGFVLDCSLSTDGGSVTIVEPEIVSGVTARIDTDGVTLCYDGAEIYTGALTDGGLSPMECLPVIVNAWRCGLADECVFEKYGDFCCAAADFVLDDDVTLRTWFDEEASLPLLAEISSAGQVVLICRIENTVLE